LPQTDHVFKSQLVRSLSGGDTSHSSSTVDAISSVAAGSTMLPPPLRSASLPDMDARGKLSAFARCWLIKGTLGTAM